MSARTTFPWLAVFAGIALMAGAGAQDAQPERGERILTTSCTSCHDLRPIEVRAQDADGWTKTINAEIKKGAKLETEDVPILTDYLVKAHGPLPDGPGKEIVLNICTQCHDLQRVRRQRSTAEGWAETLDAMLNEGAPLSEQELPVLLRYLARNFGPAR
jgi:cytochrome c5